jgi:tol-pal system protein YbgF
VTAGTGDAIGGLIENDARGALAPERPQRGRHGMPVAGPPLAGGRFRGPGAQLPGATTRPTPATPGSRDRLGYLMQRDYGAAQAAFEDFLNLYPKDSLAGNAQYWLGEAHFVRGEYTAAAGAFLKGYQNYAGNARAADSLLKLAMSLDRLGQKDAACSSYSELNTRFPDAPENVKTRAKSERQRISCP